MKPLKNQERCIEFTLQTIQILTNDVQMIILCLSYFITTVNVNDAQFLMSPLKVVKSQNQTNIVLELMFE